MRVLVETNFILEHALGQREASSAAKIFQFAARRQIRLLYPEFCIGEAYWALERKASERNTLVNGLQKQRTGIGTTRDRQRIARTLSTVTAELVALNLIEDQRLQQTINRLVRVGTPMPFDAHAVRLLSGRARKFSLERKDAVVYATVLAHLKSTRGGPALFISRDARAFAGKGVKIELERLGCDYIKTFAGAVGRITASGVLPGGR